MKAFHLNLKKTIKTIQQLTKNPYKQSNLSKKSLFFGKIFAFWMKILLNVKK